MKTDDLVAQKKEEFVGNAIEAAIRIGILFLLVSWCFDITRPFLMIVIWGIIIAVACYPIYESLRHKLPGGDVVASSVFVIVLLSLIIVPTLVLSKTAFESTINLAAQLRSGELDIPRPPEDIKNWPIVGQKLSSVWSLASENLSAALQQVKPQLESIGLWLANVVKAAGMSLLTFVAAIIISGFILANAKGARWFAHQFTTRIIGEKGHQYADLASQIIQSVTQGILGVAIIQSLLAGLGFIVMGVPAAGLWAFLCLILAVIQIGASPILIPVAIYVMSTVDTLPGILFLLWSIGVALSDNVLKPILLGRGVDVPMAVIFVGAIGGFISMGIIGLFVGAVIMALSYSVFIMWLSGDKANKSEKSA